MQNLIPMILLLALVLFAAPAFAQDESDMDEQRDSEVQERLDEEAESADDIDDDVDEETRDDMDSAQTPSDEVEKDREDKKDKKEKKEKKEKKDKKAKDRDDDDRDATGMDERTDQVDHARRRPPFRGRRHRAAGSPASGRRSSQSPPASIRRAGRPRTMP